jgi:hypothetical protein
MLLMNIICGINYLVSTESEVKRSRIWNGPVGDAGLENRD